MGAVKFEALIDREVKTLSPEEKKEVYDFLEFLKLKKVKEEDVFLAALRKTQEIGKRTGVTEREIAREIKTVRREKCLKS